MKYAIITLTWLLLATQHLQAQNVDTNPGQRIETHGSRFSKGNAKNLKYGFNLKRLAPYLEGEQAKSTFAAGQKYIRRGNRAFVVSAALLAVSIPLRNNPLPDFLALRLSSATAFTSLLFYYHGGQLTTRAISEHNAFVGQQDNAANGSSTE